MNNNLISKILATGDDKLGTFLRIGAAIIIFPHGAQKMLGWFGGSGFSGTVTWMSDSLGIPGLFAVLAIFSEFFGALFLAAGFLTRISALGFAINMIVAIFMIHLPNGFFNGAGGIEYNLTLIILCIAIIVKGGGAASVDAVLARKMNK
ncbi:MAG: DoxX family protein [Ignavibacteriaceae bacterium]